MGDTGKREVLAMTRDEILRAFEGIRVWQGGGKRAPHKPWLTQATWTIVQPVAALRRYLHECRINVGIQRKRVAFAAIRCSIKDQWDGDPFSLYVADSMKLFKSEAIALSTLESRQSLVRLAIRGDRVQWIVNIAKQAADAAAANDTRTLHSLVKSLAGFKQRPAAAVRKKDGTLTCDDREADQRWLEHFKELFDAKVSMPDHEPSHRVLPEHEVVRDYTSVSAEPYF